MQRTGCVSTQTNIIINACYLLLRGLIRFCMLLLGLFTNKSQTHLRLMLRRMREIEKQNNETATVSFNGEIIVIPVHNVVMVTLERRTDRNSTRILLRNLSLSLIFTWINLFLISY